MTILKIAQYSFPLQKWTYDTIETDDGKSFNDLYFSKQKLLETGLQMQECQHKYNHKYRIIDKFDRVVAKSYSLIEINDDWSLLINIVSSVLESRTDKHNVSDHVMECVAGKIFYL